MTEALPVLSDSASVSRCLSPSSWARSLSSLSAERLVSHMVADGAALDAAAAALAAEMLGAAPEALRLTKEVLQLAADLGIWRVA